MCPVSESRNEFVAEKICVDAVEFSMYNFHQT